uniref:Tc1-like transposase DDE domain-containing protein n=1 Tax=Hucho hucho TaxID=62062 RepID=A0A4W5N7G5_9TELE
MPLITEKTMIQHTSGLCKGYLTKDIDGVLNQMTWPPQSPDLNPIEMVWDELDRRVKEKQPTSAPSTLLEKHSR